MKINKDTLKGYILEEVLAYLIRTTGYRLLVDPIQDPQDLGWDHGRFVVKGRGGVHQVDVLGQLEWIPAFTFPLRLFVEAKFRNKKTGIGDVRNAIGVLLDINQNNSPTREQRIFPQKYQYVYALFSTSGFSKPAMEMALAHQISLIDLSGDEYNDLRNVIDRSADGIIREIGTTTDEEGYELDRICISNRGKFVSGVRTIIRRELRTLPTGVEHQEYDTQHMIRSKLEPVINTAKRHNELFVAMANGPYMLLIKANNPQAFVDYAKEHPRHRVIITWSRQIDNGHTWKIVPAEDGHVYRLSFRLPDLLSRWIFGVTDGVRERALQTKQNYFSNITIYHHTDDQDNLFKLEFDLESTQRHIEELNIG
ncbi:hypothetical protein KAX02_01310 [candidate division WOR-3 bacterium]|nr:hypothetical protein [candidate division WOR-3 bacterium]